MFDQVEIAKKYKEKREKEGPGNEVGAIKGGPWWCKSGTAQALGILDDNRENGKGRQGVGNILGLWQLTVRKWNSSISRKSAVYQEIQVSTKIENGQKIENGTHIHRFAYRSLCIK